MKLHYFFNFLLIFSSCMVYFSINPVHSVLFLILAFITASFILILFKVEFIALLFIIVYVGAIAILFLFIVMMLNIKNNNFKMNKETSFLSCISFFLGIYIFETFFLDLFNFTSFLNLNNIKIDNLNDILIFSQSLYNYNLILVLLGGLILLVAMIGAIILTLNFNNIILIESIAIQLSRSSNTVRLFSSSDMFTKKN
jgi:NADH-quinone oxidoreductase subunit J